MHKDKKTTTISIDKQIHEAAKEARINFSKTLENALKQKLSPKNRKKKQTTHKNNPQ